VEAASTEQAALKALEALAREAARCRECFSRFDVSAPTIDIAQPRWVGPSYWGAPKRICVVMLNPGSGESRTDGADAAMRRVLADFREGRTSLANVFDRQRADMPNWGRGRFWRFFVQEIGLHIDDTAFANIAWCSTSSNVYPPKMRRHCLHRFTLRLLRLLEPHWFILSGGPAGECELEIKQHVPGAGIIKTLHYAHRGGYEREADEIRRLAALLATGHRQEMQSDD
jgi:uracil-DNA glycosylase